MVASVVVAVRVAAALRSRGRRRSHNVGVGEVGDGHTVLSYAEDFVRGRRAFFLFTKGN